MLLTTLLVITSNACRRNDKSETCTVRGVEYKLFEAIRVPIKDPCSVYICVADDTLRKLNDECRSNDGECHTVGEYFFHYTHGQRRNCTCGVQLQNSSPFRVFQCLNPESVFYS
ncbi:uncharacterized protein LOC131929285 [Physella acuta]|uniref:uncharacterized protein LOC131929285 n=1 Tax=Physella acuta TaxID=109671 RepID=UPI0027DC5B26|nr:uncharacterized protein LOC131929285 [Physella acuta]